MSDDEVAKTVRDSLDKKLHDDGVLPSSSRIVMKQHDFDDFKTYEACCGNCAHYSDDERSKCILKNRIVKPTGLCEVHRYRRVR